ncbi:hypothetical protein PENSPDRAFT_510540 [Peniophora sp. CONT]|nr:hypothetical protein PENSPDRAFT_510540 [Peniophora sp. CONT]
MHIVIDLPSVVFVCINVALLFAFVSRRSSKALGTPVARWPLPFIGHGLYLALAPSQFLAWCRMKKGSVFRIILPGQNMVVVSDPASIAYLQARSSKEVGEFDYQAIGPLSGIPDARVPDIFRILHRDVYALASSALTTQRAGDLAGGTVHHLITSLRGVSADVDLSASSLYHSPCLFAASSGRRYRIPRPLICSSRVYGFTLCSPAASSSRRYRFPRPPICSSRVTGLNFC